MKKTKQIVELSDHIQRNIKIAKMCLAPSWTGTLNDFERGILTSSITNDYSMKSAEAALAGDVDALVRLLRAEQIIAVMTGVSETHKKHTEKTSAENARKKRAASNQETTLIDAIIEEHGNKKCERPSKEAGAILKAVNERLKLKKFPAVKVDVIRRRLEKFPRSDRTQ